MILLLKNICELIRAKSISLGQIAVLKMMIHDYLNLRLANFPNERLRPKHHYLTHYPSMILKFGPLTNYSTIRYESKHRYFKNGIKHLQNFKNLTFSLTEKHQLLQSLYATNKNLFSDVIVAENVYPYEADNFDKNIHNIISKECNGQPLFVATQLYFRGIKYRQGMYLCTGRNKTGQYEILQIQKMLLNKTYTLAYFFGPIREIFYCSESGVYEFFSENSKIACISYDNLPSVEPLLVYEKNYFLLFSFMETICETL